MSEFFRALAPILAANLLTVLLVFACVSHARMEREGRQDTFDAAFRVAATIMVFAFLGVGAWEWVS